VNEHQEPHALTIKVADQLGGTPLIFEAAKAYVELAENNQSQKTVLPFNWDDQAVYAIENNEVVGLIVFTHAAYRKTIFISIGWVKSTHRGKGIYKKLYHHLLNACRQKFPDHTITGGVTMENLRMHLVMEKLGRQPVGMMYEIKIMPDDISK
jgi:L-amino acid N-acyltransferase YncA